MEPKRTFTAAHIRYLLTMDELDPKNKGIRCVDIAMALGLSKPSVHGMMSIFTGWGLVEKQAYGDVFMTPAGRAVAQRYRRYYTAVAGLLGRSFPELNDVRTATCSLLAEIPPQSLEKLCSRCEAAATS